MKLSVVATLYKSEPYVDQFYRRACAAAENISEDFELVLVNDGSPDGSLDKAIALSQSDARVVVVDLSRNFGHHKAMMTGLEIANGDLVFLIDADLEEPVEILADFYVTLSSKKCDVVYGYQQSRRRGLFDRLAGDAFYRFFNIFSDIKIPPNVITARLMTRRYVRNLLRHRERVIFIDGLWAATGYEQIGLPVEKNYKGSTSYTAWKRVSLALVSITSFSDRPLLVVVAMGGLISALSFFVCVYLLYEWFTRRLLSGWPSLIASIWFLGGLTIFCVGLIGLYISKIFLEVKHRPYTIIRDIYRVGISDQKSQWESRPTAQTPP